MDKPGLKTLTTFLDQIRRRAPATYSAISEERARGYGMINRYLDYCLKENLILIHSTRRTRGRYPSKTYVLSEKGARLLDIIAPKKKTSRRAGA